MQTLHRDAVAAEVRAGIARRRLTASAVAEKIGMTTSTLSRRLNGESSFTVDELAALAMVLDMSPRDFFPHRDRTDAPKSAEAAA